jgi:cytochrome bd-type quinol oxidase subunit 2
MRYLIAYIYIVLSGVAVPFALQAHDLIGRYYLILAGEITASSLIRDFMIIASLVFTMLAISRGVTWLLFRKKPRLHRSINSAAIAAAGFVSVCLALTDHKQIYGNTWGIYDSLLAFVAPVWPAILPIVSAGAYLGMRLDEKPGGVGKAVNP